MRISDWSSDVCSSDLAFHVPGPARAKSSERGAGGFHGSWIEIDRVHPGSAQPECTHGVHAGAATDVEEAQALEIAAAEKSLQAAQGFLHVPFVPPPCVIGPVLAECETAGTGSRSMVLHVVIHFLP